MADLIVLKAERRTDSGKQVAKRLRLAGQLPAVVYGEKEAPIACAVDERALTDVLHSHGRNAIIILETGDKSQSTIVKEIQHHPVRGNILHVDFHRIDLTHKIVVEVPVDSQGTPIGVRNDGGILEHMLHHIEIECLPTGIPEHIEVDVSELGVGDSLHVSDIVLDNAELTIVTDGERTVFALAAPTLRGEDEEEEAEDELLAEDEMQEPEVIERGKRDEDEEADES